MAAPCNAPHSPLMAKAAVRYSPHTSLKTKANSTASITPTWLKTGLPTS